MGQLKSTNQAQAHRKTQERQTDRQTDTETPLTGVQGLDRLCQEDVLLFEVQ